MTFVAGLPELAGPFSGAEGALLVYLSSTGVYGDHEGAWVTEDSPCLAKDDKVRR